MKIYVTPGFHSDVVWLEDQRDYAVSLLGNVHQNLIGCRRDPDYGLFLHELTYLKPYLDLYPQEREFVKKLIQEGRLGTGGSHSQPSETIVQGESLIRNIQYGRWYHEKFLGDIPEIYMPWDVFGHTSQLAQLLKKSRFVGCIWSKSIRGARAVFWHEAPDGSVLLFKRMDYGLSVWKDGRGIPVETEEDFWLHASLHLPEIASLGLSVDSRLDTIDFKPPSSWMIGRCKELKEGHGRPHQVIISGQAHRDWFREAKDEIKQKNLDIPVIARDFEWYHQGTALSRTEYKIGNRIAENRLLDAEKWGTLAALFGAKYPDRALDKAWRQLLFLHHHDAITGTMNDRSYLDLLSGIREALELASDSRQKAVEALASLVDTHLPEPVTPVVVFNSLNWERTDLVEIKADVSSLKSKGLVLKDADGKSVLFEVVSKTTDKSGLLKEVTLWARPEKVPSFGYTTLFLSASEEALPEASEVESRYIENEFYRVEVSEEAGGNIVSILDKEAGREVLDTNNGYGNELVAMEEVGGRREPSWEVFTNGRRFFGRDYPAKITVYRGPLTERIVVEGDMFFEVKRRQEILLTRGVKRIDFSTTLKNFRIPHQLYAVIFPIAIKGAEPVFEDRFAYLTKRKSRYKYIFQTSQNWNYSDSGVRKANRWIDLTANGKILRQGKPIATFGTVHLLYPHRREVQKEAFRLQSALISKGVPVTPTYDDFDWQRRSSLPLEDAQMPTPKNFNEDLPYGTSFRVVLDVNGENQYTQRVLEQLEPKIRKAFERRLADDGVAALLTTDKKISDYWPPLPVLLISARDAKTLRQKVEALSKILSEKAELHLAENEVDSSQNFALDDYGVALLNNGTLLNSVEKDNTIVNFLFHTAAWGNTPWGKDRLPYFFVPEYRTQRFFYSLYPHSGDLRQAQTVQKGWEYNNPFLVVKTDTHRGSLPARQAFIKTETNEVILTSLKPADNPTATLHAGDVDMDKGIVLRGYEANGFPRIVKFALNLPFSSAERANLMEETDEKLEVSGGSFSLSFGPNSIETVLLRVETKSDLKGTIIGKEHETVQPIFSRFWMHNVGAAPLGYEPVAVTLHGPVQSKIHIGQGGVTLADFKVGLVNNYLNRMLKGKIVFQTAEPWRVVPSSLNVELPPGGQLLEEVTLDLGPRILRKEGLVRAIFRDAEDTYEDVLEVGSSFLPKWKIEKDGHAVRVYLSNPHPDALNGAVELITPLETWPLKIVGNYSIMEIEPRILGFSLEPGQTQMLEFTASTVLGAEGAMDADIWMIAKLMCNGYVDYLPVMGLIEP